MESYKVIGLMSGTSLDGVDIALCEFINIQEQKWQYDVLFAKTYPYDISWQENLANLHKKDALTYIQTDINYAKLLAELVKQFCAEFNCDTEIIASHGHTIFHNPVNGFTSQIGNGAFLAALTKRIVVSDFRSLDVALNGQGAPLVPVGDKLLFSTFDYCLNLGGFANISFDVDNERYAFDVCPANIILNYIFKKIPSKDLQNQHFDKGGELASKGNFNIELCEKLNNLPYYSLPYPKSLGREWLEDEFLPVLNSFEISLMDKLHTINKHIAFQIAKVLNKGNDGKVLISGGGAYNNFLISCIKQLVKSKEIIIPDSSTIEFKEALIFAFLGLLRYLEQINCLKSVTGASGNSCTGAIYLGNK